MRKITTLFFASLFSVASFSQSKGLHFDGSNDYVTIPEKAGMLTTNSFTVESWVKPTAGFFNWPYLLRKTNNSYTSGLEIYMMDEGYGTLQADLYKNGMGYGASYNLPASWTGQWHHIAVSFDGTNLRIFIDGVQASIANTSTQSQSTNGAPIYVGAYDASGTLAFPGALDELRFWNIARSQTQIQASMNTEIPAGTTGLTAYYKFNQGVIGGTNTAITSVVDQVAAHNGTMVNFARSGSASNFVLGHSSITVLAFKDASFTATKIGSTVQLNWKGLPSETASSFTVERSTNGIDFSVLRTVSGRPSATESAHAFTDAAPQPATNYYRIKSTEVDGKISYTKTLALAMNKIIAGLQVYPNPAADKLQLQLTAPKGFVLVQLKDLSGRTVQSVQVNTQGTTLYTSLDVSSLPKGVYSVSTGDTSTLFLKQ